MKKNLVVIALVIMCFVLTACKSENTTTVFPVDLPKEIIDVTTFQQTTRDDNVKDSENRVAIFYDNTNSMMGFSEKKQQESGKLYFFMKNLAEMTNENYTINNFTLEMNDNNILYWKNNESYIHKNFNKIDFYHTNDGSTFGGEDRGPLSSLFDENNIENLDNNNISIFVTDLSEQNQNLNNFAGNIKNHYPLSDGYEYYILSFSSYFKGTRWLASTTTSNKMDSYYYDGDVPIYMIAVGKKDNLDNFMQTYKSKLNYTENNDYFSSHYDEVEQQINISTIDFNDIKTMDRLNNEAYDFMFNANINKHKDLDIYDTNQNLFFDRITNQNNYFNNIDGNKNMFLYNYVNDYDNTLGKTSLNFYIEIPDNLSVNIYTDDYIAKTTNIQNLINNKEKISYFKLDEKVDEEEVETTYEFVKESQKDLIGDNIDIEYEEIIPKGSVIKDIYKKNGTVDSDVKEQYQPVDIMTANTNLLHIRIKSNNTTEMYDDGCLPLFSSKGAIFNIPIYGYDSEQNEQKTAELPGWVTNFDCTIDDSEYVNKTLGLSSFYKSLTNMFTDKTLTTDEIEEKNIKSQVKLCNLVVVLVNTPTDK